ncbi:MAG: GGDEF domain-containing protein [Lachnospiraceae bacterium]|nr:GGDEF domain-containing protein [Lachnospiraceae bacterium]
MVEELNIGGRHIVGLVIAHLNGEAEQKILHYLQRELKASGFNLLVFSSFTDLYRRDAYDKGEEAVYSLIPYDKLDALIIATRTIKIGDVTMRLANEALSHHIPVISIDDPLPGCHNIRFTYANSLETIVRHVVEHHGCRRINFMAGMRNNEYSDARIASYKKVLEEHNIPVEEDRIYYGDFWQWPTQDAMREMLSKGEVPEAIVCANDTMAMTVCSCLEDAGLKVPEDVIVTGYDGVDAERYHTPRLTTAATDYEHAAKVAVSIVKKGRDMYSCPQDYLIPDNVVFSQSCGCKPKRVTNANDRVMDLYSQMISINEFHEIMSNMISKASSAETADIPTINFGRYASFLKLKEFSFYACDNYLDDDVTDKNSGRYSEFSRMIINYQNGETVDPLVETMKTRALMLNPERLFSDNNTVLILPAHFQDIVVGHMVIVVPDDFDQFTHLQIYNSNYNQVLELLHAQYHLRKALTDLQMVFVHDYLTSLYNRRGFYTLIDDMIAQGRTSDRYLVAFSIDLNGLKYLNDTFSHQEGDYAIKTVAEALQAEAPPGAICARFGGDEFSVAFLCDSPESEASDYVRRVEAHVAKVSKLTPKPYPVSASFGYAYEIPDDNFSIDALIRTADDRMYDKKKEHPLHRRDDRR